MTHSDESRGEEMSVEKTPSRLIRLTYPAGACLSLGDDLYVVGGGGGTREGGGSLGKPAQGPGVADLQRCWACPEQSYQGRI